MSSPSPSNPVKLSIPAQFERADRFSEGLAAVMQHGKIGYIDRSGKMVIPPQFAVDTTQLDFDSVYRFYEGRAAVMQPDGTWIYIDKTGKPAFPGSFSGAYRFSNGLAAVWMGKRLSYIDRTGKVVLSAVSATYDRKIAHFSQGLVGFATSDQPGAKRGFMDATGKVVIPPTLRESQPFTEGRAAGTEDPFGDQKWGYLDQTGNWVVPPQFGMVDRFSDGLAAARPYSRGELSEFGYIDRQGNWVIPPQFSVASRFSEGLAAVEVGDRGYGYIDRTGKWVIPPQFSFADHFSEGLARVGQSDQSRYQYGFIDKTGRVVIPIGFDDAGSFSEGLAAVSMNGRWGYISR